MSNDSRGNRFKKKTKDWFEKQGYQTEYAEKYNSRFIPGKFGKPGRMFFKKSDMFGADGISINEHEIVFWNSKATEDLKKRRNEFVKGATEAFAKFNFPPTVRRVVVLWELRAKGPIIVQCL